MTEQPLITTLADFHERWALRAEELSARRAHLDEALAGAEAEIQELQQRLAAALQRRDDILAAQEQTLLAQRALPAERDAEELEQIRSTLLAGLESITAAQSRRARLAQIERDLGALLADDPELAQKLADYQAFEASREQIAALPEFHRQALLEAQERLASELQAYFELEHEVRSLQQPQPAILWIVVTELPGDMAGWVLPIAVDGELSLDEMGLDGIAAALLRALGGVTPQGQHFDGMWDRFAARLAGLQGATLRERLTQLSAALATAPELAGLDLQLRVLACSPEVWARAWDGPATLNLGWYTLDDLRAWTRRVEAGSQWGPSLRRLRTMLMRLVARGVMVPSLVSAEELWSALPEPHRGAMREAVRTLCANGILQGDPAGAVGIIPERLDEVERIITRKLPPWAVASQEPRPAMVG